MTTDLLPSFGKYSEIRRLGEGGFGEVYRAVDTTLNRAVALKVPHRELLRDPSFAAQFRAEAQTAAQLDHPNIVRIYSVGELEGTPFIEMELVEGQTLADLIRQKGRLSADEALAITEPVCAALEEAHAKGIVHRDIKPENILVRTGDGRVLVTDFGLAKSRESSFQASLSSSNVVVGTFRYMPPEQANRKLGEVGPRSDVYSLGVVLYEMLTGRVPFESKSVGQLIYAHTTESPEPPSNVNIGLSQAVESVVLKALHKRPEDRFASAKTLAQALRLALAKDQIVPGVYPEKPMIKAPAQAPSVSSVSSATSARSNPGLIIALAVFVFLVFVGAMTLLPRLLTGQNRPTPVAQMPGTAPQATSTRAGTASTDTPVGVSDPVKTDTPTVSTGTLPAGGTTVSSATNLPTRPPSDTPTPTPSATTTLTPTRLPTATPVQSSSPTTLDLPPLPAITPRPSLPAGRPSDFARPATETLEGEIRQNTILERGRGPYTVNGAVVVKQDVTLFIEPGTVLKFSDDAHLKVYGTLRAQGMPDSPIVFTSIRDDSVGGDTNQDGQSSAPVPGDWTYIGFLDSSNDAGSIIEHAVIRYAGEHRGDRHGAIHLEAASPVLRSNTISDSYWYAISADPNSFPFVQNNTLERNQGNGIAIRGGNLTVSGAWANTDIAYAVVGVVNVRESTTLLIYPGITAKFGDDVFIDVFGALKAQGAPGQEIVLTSLKDDSVGGDTNGDGESSAPGAGDWTMIRFQPTSNDANSLIAHCRIRYAGDHRGDRYGAVHISESSPRLISNSFTDNRWFAISADVNSFPTLSGNSLERNGGNGLEMRAGEERISGAWANTDTVYAITGAFRVNEGATLSIRPGVTAKFADDAYVDVFGALRVLGTADQKVILTSLKDDTAGGDTNGDGGSSAPAAGDWTMIRFRDSSSDASSVVEHARVRYAGGFRGDRFGALHMESASPRIANSELTDSLWFALSADTASFPIVSNVETRGNSGNGLEMRGGDMSNSGTWSNTGIVYVLTGSVIVLNTATLNVQPGVIVKFADSTFIGVHGTLRALGTADDPIVLTSLRDDSQGGDTNGDDRSSSPAAGDWGMLHFYDESNDANCLVENTIIRYGGKYRGDRYGAIHLISASPTIAGCTIQDSLAWGLWYDTGSTPRLRNNTFVRNPEGDTYQKQ